MKTQLLALAILGMLTQSALAHHAFSAAYDMRKPTMLSGAVSAVHWTNPHTTFEIKVAEANKATTTWTVELDDTADLEKMGWTSKTLAVGDQVKADGWVAKDGSHRLGAKSVTLKSGKVLSATSSFYEEAAGKTQ
jgi:hypothetical protein